MNNRIEIKADIIPYTSDFSVRVRSWINSPETLHHVCRGKDFPPTDDIVESWQRKNMKSYVLSSEGQPVAYGELWDRRMERSMEICHLIVDPFKQGHGFGTQMLELLYNRAATKETITKVQINLLTDNSEALGCYLKAGFELVSTSSNIEGLQMVRTVPFSR